MPHRETRVLPAALAVVLAATLSAPAFALLSASSQDGDSFETAITITPHGRYFGSLGEANRDDFYKFHLDQGAELSIDLDLGLTVGLFDFDDQTNRFGARLYDPNGVLLSTAHLNAADARITLAYAHVAGDYRLHLNYDLLEVEDYSFCFVTSPDACVTFGIKPIEIDNTPRTSEITVLLTPPPHGNPFGTETALDYLDASLRGIRKWADAMATFAAEHEEYAYLADVSVHVEIFDGTPKRAGYDAVVAWSTTTGVSPAFIAYWLYCLEEPPVECGPFDETEPYARIASRAIILPLFAHMGRSGQGMPDFPTLVDAENIAAHEFAHVYGLGHTKTWTAEHGPDIMNGPYADVYGDGHPFADGGKTSPLHCISNLNLYGLAELYSWVATGASPPARLEPLNVVLPEGVAYKLYC